MSETLTATGGVSYLWNTSDTTDVIIVTPDSSSIYIVSVTNEYGCTSEDSVAVTVYSLPEADAGQDTTVCYGTTVNLNATGGTAYEWSSGDTTASIEVTPATTTVYTVNISNSEGCTASDQVSVNILPLPLADAGSDKGICPGGQDTLVASGGISYLWNTSDTGWQIIVNPSVTTVYTVSVSDTNGCEAEDQVTVTVYTPPVADAGFDVSITSGTAASLGASGGTSYVWSTGDSTASINVSPGTTTTYTVSVTDVHGCTAADFVTVLVGTSQLPFPEAYWHKNDSVISTISGVNKVGIGTSNPSEQLTVGGNILINGKLITNRVTTPDSLIYFGDSTLVVNTASQCIYPDGGGAVKGLSIGSLSINRASLSTVIGYNIRIFNMNPMPEKSIIIGSNFKTNIQNSLIVGFSDGVLNSNPTFLVGPSGGANSIPTGNVGISTSDPSDKLQIGEGVESISFGSAICEEAGWLFGYQSFNFKRTRANNHNSSTWTCSSENSNAGGAVIGVNAQGSIIFIPVKSGLANPVSDLEMHKHQVVEITGGDVNNTDNTLDGAYMKVHGKIIAKEIEVTLNGYTNWWPDYVFEKDYSLTPLQEVEKYINLHKHLPDVPTAAEIIENGLNLGEMNAVLLKKIEELTLYIIELNKKYEELEREMKALKNNE